MVQLHEILDTHLKVNKDFYTSRVSASIINNLNPKFSIRPYQLEALGRFNFYWDNYVKSNPQPTHLLYHMATGSGKTLLMAGLIVKLYQQGFRNFLFFVNSTNIIDKTRDNFLNPQSSKYLFAQHIIINNKPVVIKEVSNFQAVNNNNINIVFTTIQGLHSSLNIPRENSLTFNDFEDQQLVLLSDEAHHINAETKKDIAITKEEKESLISWERTVNNILQANNNNLLIEFTATADMGNVNIAKKYADKLIFNYPLQQFRQDGFSKEVTVLQAAMPAFERALQAVIISQYRLKLFEQYHQAIKPVILFKSKTIAGSEAFLQEFYQRIEQLTTKDLQQIQTNNKQGIIKAAFKFFNKQNISLQDLVLELQADFSTDKLLSVNSKDDSEQKQIAVNTLEDENNRYRAIFAVDKLNEGWDVLNLFDIVRLYDSVAATTAKPDKTTVSEAQLIGRGARYCPYALPNQDKHFVRQFDADIAHSLRICETLLYHCSYNPAYIIELHTALVDIGIVADEKTTKQQVRKQAIKIAIPSVIKANDLYKKLSPVVFEVTLITNHIEQQSAFELIEKQAPTTVAQMYYLADFGEAIIRKTMHQLPIYQFYLLQQQLPYINSTSSFINDYLRKVQVNITGLQTKTANLSAIEKLAVCREVLEQVGKVIY